MGRTRLLCCRAACATWAPGWARGLAGGGGASLLPRSSQPCPGRCCGLTGSADVSRSSRSWALHAGPGRLPLKATGAGLMVSCRVCLRLGGVGVGPRRQWGAQRPSPRAPPGSSPGHVRRRGLAPAAGRRQAPLLSSALTLCTRVPTPALALVCPSPQQFLSQNWALLPPPGCDLGQAMESPPLEQGPTAGGDRQLAWARRKDQAQSLQYAP